MTVAIPFVIVVAGLAALIFADVRYDLFSRDRFPTRAARIAGYAWFSFLVLLLTGLVVASSLAPIRKEQLKDLSFWSLFTLHVVLLVFLAGWWALTQRPSLSEYINLKSNDLLRSIMAGIAIGVGGWAITIALAMSVGLILSQTGMLPKDLQPSPVIPWMAGLALWKKLLIIFSAMTVEEAFFRGWLQKRVGLVISTIIFAVAHAGYGQPMMLIGILIISIVIGIAFYRTKNLVPCIVAHGVFDAIQLLVIVPIAVKVGGIGG